MRRWVKFGVVLASDGRRCMTRRPTLTELVRRKRTGMTLDDAAKEVGVSRATLSRIEHGHRPSRMVLTKVCKWLGISPRPFWAAWLEL